MCGIFARLNPLESPVNPRHCRLATNLLTHRGPDSSGEWTNPKGDVYLGFRRLAIQDLSARANQPMRSPAFPHVLLFNGEIYNFREIRKELESLGHQFSTDGDTEVLLNALARWGEGALRKLVGMFAFLLWNEETQSALIARDFMGIKPLYFWRPPGGGLSVASESKSFYAFDDFEPEVNTAALPEYLRFRCLTGENTLLKGISQLRPGHLIHYDRRSDTVRQYRYWHPDEAVGKTGAWTTTVESLHEALRESLKLHLVSDVTVGTQFSGGVDSSLVAILVHQELKSDLVAYHCSVRDKQMNESAHASEVASAVNMAMRTTELNGGVFLSDTFERLTWHMDEPLGHPNSVGVYLVSKMAKEEAKVLLSGEGADETFCGYPRYSNSLRNLTLRRVPVLGSTLSRLPDLDVPVYNGVRSSAEWLKVEVEDELVSRTQFLQPSQLAALLASNDAPRASESQRRCILKGIAATGPLIRHQMFDILTYLPGLLIRQDKMSMAASIENRVPFVTPAMLKTGFALPRNLRATWTDQKIALKQILEKYVSPKAARRRKVGFAIPIRDWLREPSRSGRLEDALGGNSAIRDYMDGDAITRILTNFRKSGGESEAAWVLLSVNSWARLFRSKERVLEGGYAAAAVRD